MRLFGFITPNVINVTHTYYVHRWLVLVLRGRNLIMKLRTMASAMILFLAVIAIVNGIL